MEIVRDLLAENDRPTVRRYESGRIDVLGTRHTSSVILTLTDVIDGWPPQSIDELEPAHLERLTALDPRPETVLVGTGEHQVFPPQEVLAPLIDARMGFEFMDTRAACRTWNILLSEDRHAVAALILR